jgi:hypothetical protein
MKTIIICFSIICLSVPLRIFGQEPELPAGLFASDEPGAAPEEEGLSLPFDLNGFWEGRAGARTQKDPYEKDLSLGETRLQLEGEKDWDRVGIRVRTDLLYDPVYDHHSLNLESGQGWLDLREARLALTPLEFMDVKVGRQILTWGTGDMLFINDLFPKDWQSFFIGRDTEYLKAPSDALKVSLFSGLVNCDLVYTPRFDGDRFINGSRISYYNGMLGRRAGRDAVIETEKRDVWFKDDELAVRLSRNLSGSELALYGYRGYWKSPGGMDPLRGRAVFPRLAVYGGSFRGTLGGGDRQRRVRLLRLRAEPQRKQSPGQEQRAALPPGIRA